MADPQHALQKHTVVKNYRLDKVLGIGGFGVTYKGRDLNLDCNVAIKEYFPAEIASRHYNSNRISPKSSRHEEEYQHGLNRFLDEARILAQFKSSSIVRVVNFLKANGTAYIVMDYEDGLPLSKYLINRHTLNDKETLALAFPLLRGLRKLHAKGILHRDIKPPNIYLRKRGAPVLLDFGSARDSLHKAHVTNMVTPGYAPFEQYNNLEKQGPWSDIYGLGATLYRCVTGISPVNALDRFAGLQSEGADPHVPAVTLCKGRYSHSLLTVIDLMLSLKIQDRPQSVDDVLQRLSSAKEYPLEAAKTQVVTPTTTTHVWDTKTIALLSEELTKILGPISHVVLEQCKATASDSKHLINLLANEIDNNTEREQFLRNTAGMFGSENTASTTGRNSREQPSSKNPRIWNQQSLQLAEEELAKYIGPLAPTLVKLAADNCLTWDEFIETLSDDIPTTNEREEFKNSVKTKKLKSH